MDTLDKVNKLSKSDFISFFGNVFEKTTWIAEKVFNFRPFKTYDELSNKFISIFENEKKEDHLKILISHPDLAVEKTMTLDSVQEQSKAKLNECTEDEFEEFKKLNTEYKEKFKFPFIIAVSGKDKKEILEKFRKRIKNEANQEFPEAINQVKEIALLRIEQVKKKLNEN
tara:strand:+ start:431 stop:940 length:510 start_codon:yes stop_codon:yes gene_type:complete